MTIYEKKQLKILLIKYQAIYFFIVLCLSLFIVFGFSKIQYLIAESLFKTNVNELLVQDFRTVILNMSQFVPSQFVTIELVNNNQTLFVIGENTNNLFVYKNEFVTKDQMLLVFSSSYRLVLAIIIFFLILSAVVSRFINHYFTRMYSKQLADQFRLQKSELLNEISKKVAHDIRSPLSTLNMLSAVIENTEVREMQIAVTKQIDAIANDLLNFSINRNLDQSNSSESLKQLFSQIKKEYEIKSAAFNCRIVFEDNLNQDFSLSDLTVLYQNVNNFINNSIEAESKNIQVILSKSDNINISIIDDGGGMDESALNQIGKVSFTTKRNDSSGQLKSGHGIAMFNARKAFDALGWKLEVKSELGIGTTVTVIIPPV